MDVITDYKTTQKRALDIVEKDATLAYAVSNALRKRVIGRTDDARHELLNNLAYAAWNTFVELQSQSQDPRYTIKMLNLVVDTLTIGYDILTERNLPRAAPNPGPKR